MRQFVWGMICGGFAMYFYLFHGQEVRAYKDSIDSWRDDAVDKTGGYSDKPTGDQRK
ncbi:MAG: hypothetical protein ACREQJ_09320 [Candidatus Binatia bacterium]